MARTTTLKYNVLTNRLGGDGSSRPNKLASYGIQIKELLKPDEFVGQIDLLDDIVITKQQMQMFSLFQLTGFKGEKEEKQISLDASGEPNDSTAKALQERQNMMHEV